MQLLERLPPQGVHTETKLVVGVISGSHFVNHMYLVLLPPIFGILATEFDVSLALLGLAMGTQGALNMAFQLPFGYLSDNYSRSATLATGLTLSAIAVFAIAGAPSFEWLVAGQALLGIGIAAHHPAHFPMLADATHERNRGRVFSLHGFAGNLGYAATPALITAVLVFPNATWRHALALIGVIGAVYAVTSTLVLRRTVSDDVTRPANDTESAAGERSRFDSVRERVRAELRSLVTSPAIIALAVLALVTSMANWGVRTYAVVLLTDGYGLRLDAANTTYTAMFTASALLILLGGELADRLSAERIILTSYLFLLLAAVGVGTLLLSSLAAVFLVVLSGSAISFGAPARSKLTDKLSARTDLGMNFALITVGVTMAGAAAPPFFGAVIERQGFGIAFYIIAALAVVGATLTLLILRTYRDDLTA